jgi:hypothetical protein
MRPAWRVLNRLVELRRAAADVVDLADRIVYGSAAEAEVARQMLPVRLQRLAGRLQRAQAALRQEGAP